MIDQKIEIRTARLSDADELLNIYAPYVQETSVSFEYEVPSLEEFKKRMEKTQKVYPYLVAQAGREIAGYVYAGRLHERAAYDWAVETSIYVKRSRKQRGVGRRLYDALEKALKIQGMLNLNACIAYPEKEDEYLTWDSVRFHEKMGYHMVGHFKKCGYKFGRWYDMVWMEKHIGEHKAWQPPVKAYPEIMEEFEEALKNECFK